MENGSKSEVKSFTSDEEIVINLPRINTVRGRTVRTVKDVQLYHLYMIYRSKEVTIKLYNTHWLYRFLEGQKTSHF